MEHIKFWMLMFEVLSSLSEKLLTDNVQQRFIFPAFGHWKTNDTGLDISKMACFPSFGLDFWDVLTFDATGQNHAVYLCLYKGRKVSLVSKLTSIPGHVSWSATSIPSVRYNFLPRFVQFPLYKCKSTIRLWSVLVETVILHHSIHPQLTLVLYLTAAPLQTMGCKQECWHHILAGRSM